MRSGPVGGTILIVLFAARPLLAGETTPAGPEFRVNSTTTGGQRFPSIASDAQGNFVVVWQTLSGGGVFGQRYASDGSPRGSQFDVFTAGAPGLASVASDPSGAFVVVFELSDYAGNGVFGQRFDSAGVNLGGGVIFRVNSYVTGNQERPSVAVGPTGDFVVVWSSKDQDGSSYGVFGQRIASAGTPLGGEFQVNESTTGIQYRPDVATDSQGNFVVVWTGSGPSSGDVYGRRYASSGSPLGSEFRVNTYTSNNQGDPDLTVLPSGDFVVVWGSS
ncbi:MAG TPA: hypothetical protein VGR00_04795, partial [Thermoanaerobaculia bacterium]|nr:hypothetical protein [Thermoanaerobaculia bacterium]